MVATVLTVYGIETFFSVRFLIIILTVATVLTVYGIETCDSILEIISFFASCNSTYRLRY